MMFYGILTRNKTTIIKTDLTMASIPISNPTVSIREKCVMILIKYRLSVVTKS